ncbi:hypothetical protein ACQP2P_29405 [Dactylosporangium sp. CA-139114]|uniref:hypothetical protein n=1 Tax=Dactylosporangium sp. CA-139114 TaxID=3239931 RepID=UPI003D962A56
MTRSSRPLEPVTNIDIDAACVNGELPLFRDVKNGKQNLPTAEKHNVTRGGPITAAALDDLPP